MEYSVDEAKKDMHEAYLKCKTVFDPKHTLINNMVLFESEEEDFFCKTVEDFFLQRAFMEDLREQNHEK